ncbi:MAG: phage virion morphogenesis protein [Halomonas sp.]
MEIEIQGTVGEALSQLKAKAADRRAVHREIGRRMQTRIKMCFRTSTSPYGEHWPSPVLRQGAPLRDTGRLMGSIDYLADAEQVQIGTNVRYAPTHQYGATIRPKNVRWLKFADAQGGAIFAKEVTIPQRRFLPDEGLPESWQASVSEVIGEHLNGGD